MNLRPSPISIRSSGIATSLCLALLWLCAVGLSSKSEDQIPETEKNFSANLVDSTSATIEGENISVEGLLYFSVRRGEMTIFVPFEKLESVVFARESTNIDGIDRVEATFTFLDGATDRGFVKARDTLYGKSKLGNFKLKLKDLEKLRFKRS